MLMRDWMKKFLRFSQGRVPDKLCGFDIETTGFSPTEDLIVEMGHCLEDGGKIVDRASVRLNWYAVPQIDHAWLDLRLVEVRTAIEEQTGRPWSITPEALKAGIHPEKAFQFYRDFFTELESGGVTLVWHAGCTFDRRMIAAAYEECFGKPLIYPQNMTLDTRVLARAMQEFGNEKLWPKVGESVDVHAQRLMGGRGQARTKLSHCFDHFELAELAGDELDMEQLHTSEYDAYLCCLICRRLRLWLEKNGPAAI